MSRGRRAAPYALAAAALVFVLAPAPAAAQQEVVAELSGLVTRGTDALPGVEVVLHRVSADEAGEIDTARTDTAGEFRFVLPDVPREDQDGVVYFASVLHHGITYFGQPVTRAIQLDSLYRVETFDTLTAPAEGAPVPVDTRYIVASEEAHGWVLTDLFELDQRAPRTLVAQEGGVTWRHPLPAGASDAEAGGGDVAPEATVVSDGELRLTGPISPGLRTVVLRYRVPALEGLEVPIAPGTGVVEFLLREPAPNVDVVGLVPVAAVEMQPGVLFRRYAMESPPGNAIRVTRAEEETSLPVEWIAVVTALGLALAGLIAWGRRPSSVAVAPDPAGAPDAVDLRNALLLEIARLDTRLDDASLDPAERERLRARRAELVARLSRRA
ncbi:hypothetical protein V3331_06435 [Gaopeijia maritima]|uniref:hypothetical protein n=1 Tax=Gaopeijia maritima TaxID=3119007 RepID=UPI00324A7B99